MSYRIFFTLIIFVLVTCNAKSQFTDVSQSVGLDHLNWSQMKMGGGVAAFDFDNDGWEDIYLTGGKWTDKLFKNNGNGSFSLVTEAGIFPTTHQAMGVVTGDIDNDGYRDILVLTTFDEPNTLFYNNGDGTFENISISSGISNQSVWSTSAAFGDVNNDGLLDIYIVNYVEESQVIQDTADNAIGYDHDCFANNLFINNGNLTFTDASVAYNAGDIGCGLAVTFSDLDADNDVDIYIANDFGEFVIPNTALMNNFSNPTFSDESVQFGLDHQMYGMGIAVGDYDHDLDLDYYVTNIGANILVNNDGLGVFNDTALYAGVINDSLDTVVVTSWGTSFIDLNNDTYEDLVVVNGHITLADFIVNAEADPDKVYINNQDGTFQDASVSLNFGDTTLGRGLAYTDFDNDGKMDIVVVPVHWDTTSGIHTNLYKNEEVNLNNYLKIQLTGTISNRDAFGAQITMYANNDSWLHELRGGSSHMSQNSTIAHFGLGNSAQADSISIKWPSGLLEKKYDLAANQKITFIEGTVTDIKSNDHNWLSIYPTPANEILNIRHDSKLIPTRISITDLTGRLISTFDDQTQLNVAFLSKGHYILKIETVDSGIISKRFIKN